MPDDVEYVPYVKYRVVGSDTEIVLDGNSVSVTGSDEHGFFHVLSRPHKLLDPVAMSLRPPILPGGQPTSIHPVGIWRMPSMYMDFRSVIRKHADRVGVELDGDSRRP